MVFADLVGSTQLASGRDPEELRAVLERFFDAARSVLEEHGGTVEKYIGDAVMAVFGAPVAYGDDPDRAVRASLDLVERVAALGGDLAIRVGVNTGEVLASPDSGADLSVTGAPVNVAARLQQHARPGQVLVGERTARACRLVVMREVDPVPAKGLDEPLRAFQAVEKIEMPETRRVAPLVGRDDDLDLLRLVTRRAFREHVPQLVTVLGDAGIGKTRLLEELVRELRDAPDPPRVLIGRNLPTAAGSPSGRSARSCARWPAPRPTPPRRPCMPRSPSGSPSSAPPTRRSCPPSSPPRWAPAVRSSRWRATRASRTGSSAPGAG